MIRECLVDVGLVAFLGVFCKATGEVANHGHFLTGRRAGAPRTCIVGWCAKVKWLGLVMLYWINFCASTRNEILAVIFDDSVYLHGVVETNEAPELSFDLFRILFRAIIISTIRNYLSKNSPTHPIKIDQTRIHAMHFMWCRCMLWCSVVFSFYLMTVFFFREFFYIRYRIREGARMVWKTKLISEARFFSWMPPELHGNETKFFQFSSQKFFCEKELLLVE